MSRSAKSAARILLALSAAICVYAQQATTQASRFEVALVKPCVSDGEPGHRGARKGDGLESSPDRLHLPCQTLRSLIQWVWVNFAANHFNPLASVPITGGPGWIQTGLFTIDARAERPESWGTLNGPMLRALLEQRFKLRIHTESKETPVYALRVAKSGAKLQASKHDCIVLDPEHPALRLQPGRPLPAVCGMGRLNGQGWEAIDVTMDELARLLSDNADRKVVDRTGLSGTYDIHLNLTAEDFGLSLHADAEPPMGASDVFARLRASILKLGLRLEPASARGDVLVIDAAERPSEN